jgi:hypothetical protein
MDYKRFCILISLCIFGCSPRYIKKVEQGEMTQDQLDFKFYKFRKHLQLPDSSSLLKYSGCYVNLDTDDKYRLCKFMSNGEMLESFKMNTYPNLLSATNVRKAHNYYRIVGDNLEVEYLQITEGQVNNIIKKGKMNGDTIVFYQTFMARHLMKNRFQIHEVFVYDKTINLASNE